MKSMISNVPGNINPNKVERETIHSGHFMVSTFEAEEAQDDLDDSEVKMLDPEDPSLVKPGESNTCMEVQLYVPRKITQKQNIGCGNSTEIVTSHLEIETSLTKLFKCMNLAYSQKLTSPKWNHFKGVRLRWKDKIRLNNVIWRCWHMQFILKRKTLVCQFASPLDVDIHSNPESVILEGKYWKRQLAVIKAEYRKWRRNYKSTMMGFLTYDTKSELDFLDWSPINDKHLITNEDWTTDTLFSTINVPFPFPDSREIARGAGIADFIQPSLGPLQPNLDDIDLTFVELLQNTRLPSVPEEGTEEILRNVDYNFSDIMGTDQINANSLCDVTEPSAIETTESTDTPGDTNMIELDTPLSTLQYVQMEQEIPCTNNIGNRDQTIKVSTQTEENFHLSNKDTIMNESTGACLSSEMLQQMNCSTKKRYINNSVEVVSNIIGSGSTEVRHGNSNDFHIRKGRITKISQRPFRREPHNYDKAQPTLHQTNIYQQILAEQQKMEQSPYSKQQAPLTSLIISPAHQQNLGNQISYDGHTANFTSNNSNNAFEESNSEAVVPITVNNNDSNISLGDLLSDNVASDSSPLNMPSQMEKQTISRQNVKVETTSTEVLSLFNVATSGESNIINYKSHPHMVNFKKSASTGNYFNVRITECQTPTQNTYVSSEMNVEEHTPFQFTNNRTAFNGQQQTQQQFLSNSVSSQLGMLINEMPLTVPTSFNIAPCQRSLSSVHLNNSTQQISSSVLTPQVSLSVNQSVQSTHAATKEMYRSNSLPLNVTLPKILQMDQFVMPKYTQQHFMGKSSKGRLRSNSIHHQHYNHFNSQINVKSIKPTSHHIIKAPIGITTSTNTTAQLQTTTSEPILNSTISPLLATQPNLTMLPKQHSASNITITNTELSTAQNKFLTKDTKASIHKSISTASMDIQLHTAMENDMISRNYLKHSGEIEDQQQPPYKSPKKSNPLSVSLETNSLASSVATVATTTPASNTNTIKISYPIAMAKAGQLRSSNSSSSPIQNQIFIQTSDTHYELNSSTSLNAATVKLSPTQANKCARTTDNSQQRRFGHIHAEQKRRYNIKSGFDQLHDLIPQLQQHNVKLSKAAMLQKGVEHIKHLRNERNILKQQMDNLKLERDTLNNSLTHLQSVLPANGSPVTRQGTENIRKYYEEYVQYRAKENWKFWILGLIMEPLLTSYTSSVSSANVDELRRTAFLWVDQHCSLVDLRPAVSNKLKYLSMKTDLLSDPPSTLKEEVEKALTNSSNKQHPNLHGT